MSRFLAPIHSWLFNKIKTAEELEKILSKSYIENYGDTAKVVIEKIIEKYGATLEERPIEELVDSSNIHGWLQSKIAATETRQAELIGEMIYSYGKAAELIALDNYEKQAKASAGLAKELFKKDTAPEIYEALNAYILEGMPCDNVNNINIKEENLLQWKNTKCLHIDYWLSVGAPVETMYLLRYAWIKKFVETLNDKFTHEVIVEGTDTIHKIIKI